MGLARITRQSVKYLLRPVWQGAEYTDRRVSFLDLGAGGRLRHVDRE